MQANLIDLSDLVLDSYLKQIDKPESLFQIPKPSPNKQKNSTLRWPIRCSRQVFNLPTTQTLTFGEPG